MSALATATLCLACTSSPHTAKSQPRDAADPGDSMLEVSNADVTWDGDFDGFTPRVSPRAAAAFHADEETIAALIRLLSDPDRFVVAHVGLTKIAGLQYPTAPTWNGLTIELGPDGRATIDPEQRHALARRWQAWRVASPRPRVLP